MSVPNELSDEESLQDAFIQNTKFLHHENKPSVVGRPSKIDTKVAEDDGESDMSIPDEL